MLVFLFLIIKKQLNNFIKYNQHGRTALMYATRDGQTQIAKLLIAKGADLDIKNDVSNCSYQYLFLY